MDVRIRVTLSKEIARELGALQGTVTAIAGCQCCSKLIFGVEVDGYGGKLAWLDDSEFSLAALECRADDGALIARENLQ